ncbi:MAG: redox-sensing transcriptional repressor Rex [Candidatus Sumerlaeia bacterium]|nr:redox-sensing transcriptional repressor Rex [Candidatus Sumerlaeia bacterium]
MNPGDLSTPPARPVVEDASHPIPTAQIPKAVVRRLSLYARALQRLEQAGREKVSSEELAKILGCKSAQVRKDFAYFGQFGTPGLGYPVSSLRQEIAKILGSDRELHVAVVGVGNLGSALLNYGGFTKQGYRMICGFDADPSRWHETGPAKIPVYPVAELGRRIREQKIHIVVLAVPAEAAQEVAATCAEAGAEGIMSFVPARLRLPEHVRVHQVDLALELESLGFYVR